MRKEVIIYSTYRCVYCQKLKDWLSRHKVKYTEIDVAGDDEAADKMIRESGQVGVPVWKVIEGGKTKKVVVGFNPKALKEEFGA